MKAINTRYAGHFFRSRLEARWAVAFDAANILWDYEPEGFDLGSAGCYLPDFWLPQVNMWAEVKGNLPTINEQRKAHSLASQSNHPVLFLVGKPHYGFFWAIQPLNDKWGWNYRLDDGTKTKIMNYEIFGHYYHLTEQRFYMNVGYGAEEFPFPNPGTPRYSVICNLDPVAKALSARFEHH